MSSDHRNRVEALAAFLRVPGATVSLSEWRALDRDTRAELAAAGHRVWLERCMDLALAMTPLGPEALKARLDGGEAHDEALREVFTDLVAERLTRG